MHQSAVILKWARGEGNDVLLTMEALKLWEMLGSKESQFSKWMLKGGEMGKCSDLGDLDKGQMVVTGSKHLLSPWSHDNSRWVCRYLAMGGIGSITTNWTRVLQVL